MDLPKDFDKSKIDVSKVFMTYMLTIGDVERTALALDMDPRVVEALAEQEDWNVKIKRLTVLSKSEKPGDFERAANRALNYIQANQIRKVIEVVMTAIQNKTPEQLVDAMQSTDKSGRVHISGRFLADIAKATESVHALTYAALGDSTAERKEAAKTAGDNEDAASMHAAVIAALNAPNPPENPHPGPSGVSKLLKAEVDAKVIEIGDSVKMAQPSEGKRDVKQLDDED